MEVSKGLVGRYSEKSRLSTISHLVLFLVLSVPMWAQTAWQPNGNNIYFSGGNVGIGTPSPGTARVNIVSPTADNASYGLIVQNSNSSPILYARGDGSVGIGTAGPAYKLQVSDPNTSDEVIGDFRGTASSGYALIRAEFGNNAADFGINPSGGVYIRATANVSVTNPAFQVLHNTGSTPLITALGGGNVGIGTTNPQQKLSVNGTVGAREVIVTTTGWSDYVFRPDYRLRPLNVVASYIRENHHLPDIPSEAEVQERGVSVGDMQAKLLAKIEELTLYMIRTQEEVSALREENRELRSTVENLEQSR